MTSRKKTISRYTTAPQLNELKTVGVSGCKVIEGFQQCFMRAAKKITLFIIRCSIESDKSLHGTRAGGQLVFMFFFGMSLQFPLCKYKKSAPLPSRNNPDSCAKILEI